MVSQTDPAIGIIGGSGLYQIDGMTIEDEVRLTTPFGDPSDYFIVGRYQQQKVVFLPRHGKGHRLSPSRINYRANIHGLKQLGVNRIVSLSAVGSMKESLSPGMMVVVDQFIDHTRQRQSTFFDDGVVAHVAFADPICAALAQMLDESVSSVGTSVQKGGTYICIEGPQFSSRAESQLFRSWGVDVIGMTNVTEAKLAREAECCYATLAMVTDYDCWRSSTADVDIQEILAVLRRNVEIAKKTVIALLDRVGHHPPDITCTCQQALRHAMVTDLSTVSKEKRQRLSLLIGCTGD